MTTLNMANRDSSVYYLSLKIVHVHLHRCGASYPWPTLHLVLTIVALRLLIVVEVCSTSALACRVRVLVARQVTLSAARISVTTPRQHISVRVHLILQSLALSVAQAITIGDSLEHIEPNGAFLAFKVPWL